MALVADAVPVATALVRTAGRLVGEVLAPLVNLINPDVLVVGGSLPTTEPLMAALRSALHERCLPPSTPAI